MKKDVVTALLALFIVAAATFALAGVRPDLPNVPSTPFEAEVHGAKAKPDPNDQVVMHVNGEAITESEFNAFAAAAPAESRAFYATPQGKRMLADELVKLKALEQEGRRLGIDREKDVRSQLDTISSQVVAGRALEKLVKEGIDKRLASEYAKEKGSAKTLRHILVAYQGSAVPPKSGQPLAPAQAMEKARGIVAKIRAGMKFEQVARTDSDDVQTAGNGGILGAARPDQLPPNIAAVVNTLKAGQVSDPVQTEFGVHVFKVDEPSMEELRPMLTERVQRDVAQETVERLQKGAKVELNETFFGPAGPKSNG